MGMGMIISGGPAKIGMTDAQIIALGEAVMARNFSCGHPQIAENTLPGNVGVRCGICQRRALASGAGQA